MLEFTERNQLAIQKMKAVTKHPPGRRRATARVQLRRSAQTSPMTITAVHGQGMLGGAIRMSISVAAKNAMPPKKKFRSRLLGR